ncbi:NRAMP family divalent metal transporter [Haliangium sp.]|uniref:NRAMP family divalent metal transporter n=1 Tax=Haliangium sp. TaxID=2663208 RepID=UPI003D0D6157
MPERRNFLTQTWGPGLLFAGAAVGVSHLVQSTRAGAAYGLGLTLVIVVANLFKYPAFSFGPRYAAATGRSLLDGYRSQGRWALVLYGLLTVATMFTVVAAVALVSAGLGKALFSLSWGAPALSMVLLVVCAGLLAAGHYRLLDRLMKVIVSILTVLTLAATVLVLPKIEWGQAQWWPAAEQWNLATVGFLVALIGWMPSGLDVSVWNSLWTLAKRRDTSHAPTVGEALLDFRIGYIGTALLALCFMLLGAGVLHGSGTEIAAQPGAFANQVIGLYTETLGAWSYSLIGGCAFAVMFSTTLAVLDGFPRALSALVHCYRGQDAAEQAEGGRVYWGCLLVLGGGATFVIYQLAATKDFRVLIDIATSITFLTAPVLAGLNHRAMFAAEVPQAARPSALMYWASLAAIALFGGFALLWLYLRFV